MYISFNVTVRPDRLDWQSKATSDFSIELPDNYDVEYDFGTLCNVVIRAAIEKARYASTEKEEES